MLSTMSEHDLVLQRRTLRQAEGPRKRVRQAVPTDGVDEIARIARARALIQSGRLQQLRETGGLSLAEIGRACGVNPSTVHRWLRHETMPRGAAALALYELAATLSEALGEFL